MILIIAMLVPTFKMIYIDTLEYFIIFCLSIIGVALVILAMSFILKKSNKKVKNNRLYCDLESTFKLTIDDKYIIRENEFSTVKVLIKKIENIKILKYGVVICAEAQRVDIFIPKDILPISVNEFIDIVKKENSSLLIDEAAKREKKRLAKYCLVALIISLLSLVVAYFVGKYEYEHNFTRYELVMSNELVIQENHKLLYENNKLGFKLDFPSKWEGKFGIEELDDRINVYYLANGEQGPKTTLLFSIVGVSSIVDNDDFNIIKVENNINGMYTFLGPKVIYTLEKGTDEVIEYNRLYRDIYNIKLQ